MFQNLKAWQTKFINWTLGLLVCGLFYGGLILFAAPEGKRVDAALDLAWILMLAAGLGVAFSAGVSAIGAAVIGVWYLTFKMGFHREPVPSLGAAFGIGFFALIAAGFVWVILGGGLFEGACTRASADC